MEHQNWEQYIIHCKTNTKGKNETKKKELTKEQNIEKKVNEDNLKHKKIDKEFSKKLQQARLNKNLTQKQLANQLNIQVTIINDYECCRGNYNGQIIGKLKKYLFLRGFSRFTLRIILILIIFQNLCYR